MQRIEFSVAESAYERAVTLLSNRAPQGWEESLSPVDGRTWFTFHIDDHPLADELVALLSREFPDSAVRVSEIDEQNWALAWREFFTPVMAGEAFEVLPPWLAASGGPGRKSIVIEPKMAFGTGHHPTTALCLEAIGELSQGGRIGPDTRFLDIGTGSGILAIGLALLGLSGVGVDIDPQAVACATENLAANNVSDRVALAVGGVESVRPKPGYGLVVANILSGPLIALAPDIAARLAPNGVLVLSGVLTEQAPGVAAAYGRRGLPAPVFRHSGEWAALVFDTAAKS
ncbi:Ribosomal protein L11 methyltransferase [Alkalidesulfovibrio alkalitolerans DSM 16529]|uniref:Ribosomal protein L11 methyltransferase n=1 Tax=Alkalidesulfovibrio alkalitolerans DSM 16529 TaxID=1121439 RepID=S7TD78_9BACT|nr:50S ribosomal protein L11 methyltransferase [Alkalidesulfovibrio alkalitolerans]EPR34611.1 Ribosomal protein L11 methyltransferase [Alkalidesulfovibrio alkalitolerans DSM 16529]